LDDIIDNQIMILQTKGWNKKDIYSTEIRKAVLYLIEEEKREYEKIMNDNILLYRVHGIEPTKDLDTDIYKDYLNEKINQRDERMLQDFNKKKNHDIGFDEQIKNEIIGKQLKAQGNG